MTPLHRPGGVDRIETRLDGFSSQMRRCLIKAILQEKSAVSAHDPVQTMEEEAVEAVAAGSWRMCSMSRCQRSSGVVPSELWSVRCWTSSHAQSDQVAIS
jgi:hypothetical protein